MPCSFASTKIPKVPVISSPAALAYRRAYRFVARRAKCECELLSEFMELKGKQPLRRDWENQCNFEAHPSARDRYGFDPCIFMQATVIVNALHQAGG